MAPKPNHTYFSVFHDLKNKYRLGYHEFMIEKVTKSQGGSIFWISLTLTGEKALGIGGNKFILKN
jgi:hypothetical protein